MRWPGSKAVVSNGVLLMKCCRAAGCNGDVNWFEISAVMWYWLCVRKVLKFRFQWPILQTCMRYYLDILPKRFKSSWESKMMCAPAPDDIRCRSIRDADTRISFLVFWDISTSRNPAKSFCSGLRKTSVWRFIPKSWSGPDTSGLRSSSRAPDLTTEQDELSSCPSTQGSKKFAFEGELLLLIPNSDWSKDFSFSCRPWWLRIARNCVFRRWPLRWMLRLLSSRSGEVDPGTTLRKANCISVFGCVASCNILLCDALLLLLNWVLYWTTPFSDSFVMKFILTYMQCKIQKGCTHAWHKAWIQSFSRHENSGQLTKFSGVSDICFWSWCKSNLSAFTPSAKRALCHSRRSYQSKMSNVRASGKMGKNKWNDLLNIRGIKDTHAKWCICMKIENIDLLSLSTILLICHAIDEPPIYGPKHANMMATKTHNQKQEAGSKPKYQSKRDWRLSWSFLGLRFVDNVFTGKITAK